MSHSVEQEKALNKTAKDVSNEIMKDPFVSANIIILVGQDDGISLSFHTGCLHAADALLEHAK